MRKNSINWRSLHVLKKGKTGGAPIGHWYFLQECCSNVFLQASWLYFREKLLDAFAIVFNVSFWFDR